MTKCNRWTSVDSHNVSLDHASRVSDKSCKSTAKKTKDLLVTSGVPQGLIFGSLRTLCFVNDFPDNLSELRCGYAVDFKTLPLNQKNS